MVYKICNNKKKDSTLADPSQAVVDWSVDSNVSTETNISVTPTKPTVAFPYSSYKNHLAELDDNWMTRFTLLT